MEQQFAMPMTQKSRIQGLGKKRTKALDIFVKTRDKLESINSNLDLEKQKTKEARERLLQQIKEQEELMTSCEEMKAQNEGTIEKINKIIE
jgi:predicted nuclease with TOPRIM domain